MKLYAMKRVQRLSKKMIVAGFLLSVSVQPCFAESLYEYYLTATPDTLQQETRTMGKELAITFDHDDIGAKQQAIDFAEYASNMHKMILYATKLGGYGDYKTDLQFARDKEVLQSLPEPSVQADEEKIARDNRRFADSKFSRLETNVLEEIDTYLDMIKLALDGCETLAQNDLTGFMVNEDNKERMLDFYEGDQFAAYDAVSRQMENRWPKLSSRIQKQVKLWQFNDRGKGTPIIDPQITGALM